MVSYLWRMDGLGGADESATSDGHASICLNIRMLGPVQVDVDDVECAVSARRQRAVLAYLALNAGQAVPADRLLEAIWGDNLPQTGVKAVAFQISKLRSLLDPDRAAEGSVIVTSPAGYLLNLGGGSVDVREFEGLIVAARDVLDSDPKQCQELLDKALHLWRGQPFADLGDEAFVDVEIRRLEESRLLARRTLAEARLAQGRNADVVAELETLIEEQPLEEGVVQLLMTALHRSGRTSDALRAYGDLRRRLGSELGIEPSGQLKQLEQQLLIGDGDRSVTVSNVGSPSGTRGNLPSPLSSFIGRTDEIREISELLSTTRLVSLVSFGGVGKTRLAIEVASNLVDSFEDGVWFLDLVPIADERQLADEFIVATGHLNIHDADPVEYLLSQLAKSNMLIVVDNCEHIVRDVADLIEHVLQVAPDVRVLATSRLGLGVAGEAVWHVQPLAVSTAAFDLFVERAQLVRPGFVVDDANRGVIEQICERLDGIPLAIELAAARLKATTVDQISEHLDDRFRLLTSADERQKSLLATMTWSYDLLSDAERDLLRKLWVFSDGFTLEAAVAMGPGEAIATVDVLDGLSSLVDTSLIAFEENSGSARYRILETVRQFVEGQLDGDAREDVRLRHAEYYRAVAVSVDEMLSRNSDEWTRLANPELGNFRSAMAWAFENERERLGMSMASHLWQFFWSRTSHRENLRWTRTALEHVRTGGDDLLLTAANMAIEAYNVGDREAEQFAMTYVNSGFDSVIDPTVKSRLLCVQAVTMLDYDPRAGAALLKKAWEAGPGGRRESYAILYNEVQFAWLIGEVADNDTMLERLNQTEIESPNPSPRSALIRTAVATRSGRWEEAVDLAEKMVVHEETVRIALKLHHSEALGALGRFDEAIAQIPPLETEEMSADLQQVHLVLAPVDLARGEVSSALDRLGTLVELIAGDDRRKAMAMHVAALLAIGAEQIGQHENAAILFGFAYAEQDRLDIMLRMSDRARAEHAAVSCREVLGEELFENLAAEGADTPFSDLPSIKINSSDSDL